ncbi:PREDICTED: uncharacterized protein LOC105362967 [Ceratosolen solmsi marchali]|uniref:Uncharacterized protein LOC105362967 n=1 Tax=Ceratosolen solmsi marchali TaxID=326594 RepID=A0AAJ6YIS0_9HYME|nr:PREDICTED: uncharacterized protein LOC105362967 [Ceratosolen solmsi marchali]
MPGAKSAEPSSCCQDKNLTSQKPITPSKRNESPTKHKGADKTKCPRKSKLEDEKPSCDIEASEHPGPSPEEVKARRMRILLRKQKRAEEQLKMMFETSVDPFEKPLRWWEHPHVKYAFSHSVVKSRLESLMGTNIVRLTDRKYMLTLIAKIREEHENQQAARIQERKTRELMRTKTMILNRFMTIEEAQAEIRQYPLFQLYLYCDSISRRPQKMRLPKKVKISESLYRLLYPEKLADDLQLTQNLSFIEDEEEEIDEDEGSQGEEEMEDKVSRKKHTAEPENEYMFSQDEYDNLHYVADAVKKLKEIKTVNAMYAKAYDIVGNLFSLVAKKRKKCTLD